MKNLLLATILSFMTLACLAQQHRALLVGVADYPENSGWRKIHSDNDVALLQNVLEKSFDVVSSLINEKATYSNICTQLEALKNSTNEGDTVLISFSCHGQQMLSHDKNEPDSLDEALIPYDAFEKYSNSYQGENHLKDDYLSRCVTEIRKRAGVTGFVLVLLDACHSGDSYRNSNVRANADSFFYRGGYPVFGLGGEKIEHVRRDLKDIVQMDIMTNASDVLYISACQSYQTNAEMKYGDKWYGSLVYAFCEAYNAHGLNNLTMLCFDIQNKITAYNKISKQTPEFATSIPNLLQPTPVPTEDCNGNCEDNCKCSSDCNCSTESNSSLIPIAAVLLLIVVILCVWKRK